MPILPGTPGVLSLSRLLSSTLEVHRKNNFRVKFLFTPRAGALPAGMSTFADLMAAPGDLAQSAKGNSRVYTNVLRSLGGTVTVPFDAQFNPPEFQVERRETRRGNRTISYSGWITTSTATLGVNLLIDTPYQAFFQAWAETCGGIGKDAASTTLDIASMTPADLQAGEKANIRIASAKAYKSDAVVEKLGPDGSLVGVWILQGVWPFRVQVDGLDNSASGDQLKMTVDFAVDAARVVL